MMRREPSGIALGSNVPSTRGASAAAQLELAGLDDSSVAGSDFAAIGAAIATEGLFATTPTTTDASPQGLAAVAPMGDFWNAAETTVETTLAPGGEINAEIAAATEETTTETATPTLTPTVMPYSGVWASGQVADGASSSSPTGGTPARMQGRAEISSTTELLATVATTTAAFGLPYASVVAPPLEDSVANITHGDHADDVYTPTPADLTAQSGEVSVAQSGDAAVASRATTEPPPVTPPLGPQRESVLTGDTLRAVKAPILGDSIGAGSDIGLGTPPHLTKEDLRSLGVVANVEIPTVVKPAPLVAAALTRAQIPEQAVPSTTSAQQQTTTLQPPPTQQEVDQLSREVHDLQKLLPGALTSRLDPGVGAPRMLASGLPPGLPVLAPSVAMATTAAPLVAAAMPAPVPAPPAAPAPSVVVVPVIVAYPGGTASANGIPGLPTAQSVAPGVASMSPPVASPMSAPMMAAVPAAVAPPQMSQPMQMAPVMQPPMSAVGQVAQAQAPTAAVPAAQPQMMAPAEPFAVFQTAPPTQMVAMPAASAAPQMAYPAPMAVMQPQASAIQPAFGAALPASIPAPVPVFQQEAIATNPASQQAVVLGTPTAFLDVSDAESAKRSHPDGARQVKKSELEPRRRAREASRTAVVRAKGSLEQVVLGPSEKEA